MDVKLANAATAYATAIRRLKEAGAATAAEKPKPGFGDMVAHAVRGAVEAGRRGEAVSMKALANGADVNEIVTAVTNAEVTLQTVIAVRDRVIQAYNDIIKMPI